MNINRKKIIYKSSYRGCKETDFLIGKFAKNNLQLIEDKYLDLYFSFLNEDDADIYDWIIKNKKYDDKYNDIISDIKIYHKLCNINNISTN